MSLIASAHTYAGSLGKEKRIISVPIADVPTEEKRALVIGVDDYQNTDKLSDCSRDARAFAALLKSNFGFTHVTLLSDDPSAKCRPTYMNLRHELRLLLRTVAPGKTQTVVFYSGHGAIGNGSANWLIPEDGDPSDISGTCINYTDFQSRMELARPARALLIMDACRSMGGKSSNGSGFGAKHILLGPQIAELDSCQPTEISQEGDPQDFDQSVFTHYLIKGLSGDPAATVDGRVVTFDSLKIYLQERVSQYVADKYSQSQLPAGQATFGGMVLALCGQGTAASPSPITRPNKPLAALSDRASINARFISLWTDASGNILEWIQSPKGMKADAIREALGQGADVNARTRSGQTALMAAVASLGHDDVTKILLAAGADINAKDAGGNTAMMYAAHNQNVNAVNWLIAAGADPNAATEFHFTPLMLAVLGGNRQIAKAMLDAGSDKNARDNWGVTPLISAARCGVSDDVSLFLNAGADKDARDNSGKTALMYASLFGRSQIVKMLIDAGANKDIMDADGHTAVYYANHCNSDIPSDEKAATVSAFEAGGVNKNLQNE